MRRKIKTILLTMMIVFSSLGYYTMPIYADETPNETVLEGTFKEDLSETNSSDFQTNLGTLSSDNPLQYTQNGLRGVSDGDSFVFSDSEAKDFVYEADIKFNESKGAASLVFRASDDLGNKSMYVANINGENGEARIFKFEGNDTVDLGPIKKIALHEKNEYHLKVTAIGKHFVYYVNGELVINTADYALSDNANYVHYGQNDAILEGKLGLLTWNSDVSYQNVYYQEITDANTPQASNLAIEAKNADGKVDKQISFMEGQYVYIGYVTNKTNAIGLDIQKTSGTNIVVTNEKEEICDIDNVPLQVGKNVITLTMTNGHAKVIYRLKIHRMQPDETYYNEDYRGQYHYSVKDGWGNDPNGMVYFNGKYHLFYQFYDNAKWGPMHWAHATSEDLIHWEEQPVTFYPDEYGTMYSGCAVIADHNTAPAIFDNGEEGIVFLITANGTNGGDGQRIIAAYSKDGETFQKYEEGKVILDWKDDSLQSSDFRDPKVFRYENKWFMVIAGGPLRIYSSDDLVNWQEESTYPDLHMECPDLYPLQVKDTSGNYTGDIKWVLNRGGRKYKIGDFKQVDGKWAFVPDDQYESPNANGMGNEDNDGIMNFGMDSYAGMTYYMGDFGTKTSPNNQRIIAINWMNTWADGFNNTIPDRNGNTVFNGTFNLQCELTVLKEGDQYYLRQDPIQEYQSLRDTSVDFQNVDITSTNNVLKDIKGTSYEIISHFTPGQNTTEIGFKVRTSSDEETVIKYNLETEILSMDRSKSGVLIIDTGMFNINSQKVTKNSDGSIDLHIYVDRSSVEVFTKNNTVTGAMQIFAPIVSDGLDVYSLGGSSKADITIYQLDSIWKDKLTVTEPFAINLNKDHIIGRVGDQFDLKAWVSPGVASQEVIYRCDDTDMIRIDENGNNATITILKDGSTTITVSSKDHPEIKKECTVVVYKENFATNLTTFKPMSGTWYINDTAYHGEYNDNAYMYSNKLLSNNFTYEVDVTYSKGIINFIFGSQTTNAFDGCYALQISESNDVRLFDFKGDKTFTVANSLVKPSDHKYHVKIVQQGNNIQAYINDVKYIDYTVSDTDRMYTSGYVGLGLYSSSADFENFFVYTDAPVTKIVNQFDAVVAPFDCTKEQLLALLPQSAKVAGDDDIIKASEENIAWDVNNVKFTKPGQYTITGTTDSGLMTQIQVEIRSKAALQELINSSHYDSTKYTKESYDRYMEALADAKDIIANEEVTQKQVDEAVDTLNRGIQDLVLIDANVVITPEQTTQDKATEKGLIETGDTNPLALYETIFLVSLLSLLYLKRNSFSIKK